MFLYVSCLVTIVPPYGRFYFGWNSYPIKSGLLCYKKHYDKSMRRFAVLFFIVLVLSSNAAKAEDSDLWDNFGDTNVYGQTPVTDEEFEKALESKKGKPKKPKDKLLRNGESYQQSNETQFLTAMPKELPILLVPLNLAIKEDRILPVGHYQVTGERQNGKIYLKLYQAHNLLASLEATETNDDFGEEEINFVKLLPENQNQVKIIFGSVDFNAYTLVKVAE